jgi:enoyl-CoA hydratase/carnithine racemase
VFTPDDTAEWGIWNGVAADGEKAVAMAREYAQRLATTVGPRAVQVTKRQIYDDLLRHDVGASIADAERLLNEATGTAEYREGVAALRDRRPPQF